MYSKVEESNLPYDRRLVHQMQQELFSYMNLSYQSIDIPVNNFQTIHTIVIKSKFEKNRSKDFFLGHGFGGSSLMNFTIVQPLLKRGNVIFWEIRGMGFSKKVQNYTESTIEEIDQYFLSTIRVLLNHFKPKNSTFICHSFSSYLLLRFITKYPDLTKKHIEDLLLLSTIGITPKQQDYKNFIKGCSDVMHTIINKIGWTFKLTYKSLLRTICRCCKDSFIEKHMDQLDMNGKEKELTAKIIKTLILLPDGSQSLFFSYFQPRVLPKVAIQPLVVNQPEAKVLLVYGGQQDWVDKIGAARIAQRFPDKIKIITLQTCGHHIPMHTKECIKLFQQVLQ